MYMDTDIKQNKYQITGMKLHNKKRHMVNAEKQNLYRPTIYNHR